MGRFAAKSVIVTGSSGGIGRATAVLFAKEGASVTITGRNAQSLEKTKSEMLAAGSKAEKINIVLGDVTDKAVQKKIIESTVAKFKKIDILVNNAGGIPPAPERAHGFALSEEMYQKTMDVNINSVMQLIKLAQPHLIETKGEIVNVSSIVSLNFASPETPYYAIAKAALDQYTRSIAIELIKHDVRVNNVNPGMVETNFLTSAGMPQAASDKMYSFFHNRRDLLPAGRPAIPQEIATIIAFLADRTLSFFIVGQCIVADGGSTIQRSSGAAGQMEKILHPERAQGQTH